MRDQLPPTAARLYSLYAHATIQSSLLDAFSVALHEKKEIIQNLNAEVSSELWLRCFVRRNTGITLSHGAAKTRTLSHMLLPILLVFVDCDVEARTH